MDVLPPRGGFDSERDLERSDDTTRITPARGFDSSGLMQKAMDWFSITPSRGFESQYPISVNVDELRYYPLTGLNPLAYCFQGVY